MRTTIMKTDNGFAILQQDDNGVTIGNISIEGDTREHLQSAFDKWIMTFFFGKED